MSLKHAAKLLCLWLALASYAGQAFAAGIAPEHAKLGGAEHMQTRHAGFDDHERANSPQKAQHNSHQQHAAQHHGSEHDLNNTHLEKSHDHSAQQSHCPEQQCDCDLSCANGHCANAALGNASLALAEAPNQLAANHTSATLLQNATSVYRPPIQL